MSSRRYRRGLIACAVLVALAGLGFGYTKVMARIGSGTPPAAATVQADRIMVSKTDKALYLMRGGQIMRRYAIAMGANWDQGHKTTEGDERTPEGRYVIDWRNANSVAHLSLHISYPDAADTASAKAAGRDPGGAIMIHGLPNGWGALAPLHLWRDWTDGCIAVTNAEMQEIWALVPDGTPIEIYPQWHPDPAQG